MTTQKEPARLHLRAVFEQQHTDKTRLNEAEKELADHMGHIDEYIELGHWKAAADLLYNVIRIEGWITFLEARIAINQEWLDSIRPGQPTID